MIVLDASAAIDWLLQTAVGQQIETRIYSRGESLHAPHLLDLEVAQVLRRLVREAAISAQRADHALQDLLNLRVTRYAHFVFLPQIWRLRHNLSAYDAAYVALAEKLGATLITRDTRLSATCPRDAHRIVLRSCSEPLIHLHRPHSLSTQRVVKAPSCERDHDQQCKYCCGCIPLGEVGGEGYVAQHVHGKSPDRQRHQTEAQDNHGQHAIDEKNGRDIPTASKMTCWP